MVPLRIYSLRFLHVEPYGGCAYVVSDMARTFEAEPANVAAYMGDVVMFSCKIAGIPRPSIVWLKDDREISTPTANFVVHEEDGILEIQTVQFANFGRYRFVSSVLVRA